MRDLAIRASRRRAATMFGLGALALLTWAVAQDEPAQVGGPFTVASLDGMYVFVGGLEANPEDPSQSFAYWVLTIYNGDGTGQIVTIGENFPGEPSADGEPTRMSSVEDLETPIAGTYEVNPNGTFVLMNVAGDVVYDGLILLAETIDGVPIATEFMIFHREPDPETGGLRTGRGYRQRPR